MAKKMVDRARLKRKSTSLIDLLQRACFGGVYYYSVDGVQLVHEKDICDAYFSDGVYDITGVTK